MKKLITLLLFACFAQLSFAQNILPRPNPPKLVNDVAGVLSPEQREILEQKLVALDDSSSNRKGQSRTNECVIGRKEQLTCLDH